MPITYDFTDQVALITGAGSGMGAATARRFAAAGAAVVLVDLDTPVLHVLGEELVDSGVRAIVAPADVSDEAAVAAAIEAGVSAFGRLDAAFNAAGIQAPVTDHADEDAAQYDRIQDVNLRGVWAAMKHELRQMRQQGSGAIVNCSSLGGLVGNPGRAAYHASKYGVIGLTTSTALDYAPRGVRVNAICPGTIATPMVERMIAEGDLDRDAVAAGTPMRRLGKADEIADAVLWLSSDASSYVTGIALPVDGGYTAQ